MPGKYAQNYMGGKAGDKAMAQSSLGDNKRRKMDTRIKNKGMRGGKRG